MLLGINQLLIDSNLMYGLADLLFIKNNIMFRQEQSKQEITQKELQLYQQQISKLNENIKRVQKEQITIYFLL